MDPSWYVQDGDSEVIGPVTTALLIEGVRARRVPVSARLCAVGASEWLPLATHPAFTSVVREVAPPPAPPPPPRHEHNASPITDAAEPAHGIGPFLVMGGGLLLVVGSLAGLALFLGMRDSGASTSSDDAGTPVLSRSPTIPAAAPEPEPVSPPSTSIAAMAAAERCYTLAPDGWHAQIECASPDLAERALFDVLYAYHSKLNPWGGKPEIKREERLMTPDGHSMKVKYRVIQRDKFGEERGEGSDWLMAQTFELEDGKWESGVNLMETMHY